MNSTFNPNCSDELYTFLMKYSSPNQAESVPFLKAALILLLLHPLIIKRERDDKIKSSSSSSKLRCILLQIIGRCVRRANRAQLKTLPITVPLLLPHLPEKHLFHKIVIDLHSDLAERFKKHQKDMPALYNDPLAANLLIVFDYFYLINESFSAISYSGLLDANLFYHPFPVTFDVCEDYAHWREQSSNSTATERHLPFAFCDYPWILNLELKGTLLAASNGLKQRHHLQDAFFRAIFDGVQSTSLNLLVNRSRVLEDARDQLLNHAEYQLAKQLRVTFQGEEGVDEGGLRKEFFHLCFSELFENEQLFKEVDNHMFWFNTCDSFVDYKFIGILFALAIYNGVLIGPRFPLLLFKKLLNWPINLDDYSEIDSILVNSIHKLDNDDSFTDLYYLVPGTDIELIPNGSNIPVTRENISLYIQKLSFYYLNDSIRPQFDAFRSGFEMVSAGSVIYGYRPDELSALTYGSDTFDICELADIAVYDGGYTSNCIQIHWLWNCLINHFTLKEQQDFLSFVTGSNRAPLAGLKQLKSFTITKASAGDTERLPTAHTCFNTLLLPEYSCEEKLKIKLRLAITHHEGFGLI